MWIASKLGFFSIVVKGPEVYHVRARVKRDLLNLHAAAKFPEKVTVRTSKNADYKYRILVGTQGIAAIFKALEDSIDYPNFKGQIAATPDQAPKLHSYHRIWSEMMFHQE